MAEWSGFFPSINGDRKYRTAHVAATTDILFHSGVCRKGDFALAPAGGMYATLGPGWALVNGYHYQNDGPLTLAFAYADGVLDRIDLVVIRRSVNTRDIHAIVIKGKPAITPKPPDIVRDAEIHDLCAYYVRIPAGATAITASMIYDKRADPDLCGYVYCKFKGISTEEMLAQYEAWFTELTAGAAADLLGLENQFSVWFNHMKELFAEDPVGGLQTQIDTLNKQKADAEVVNEALKGKAASSHTHDDRYYTETEADKLLAGKAASSHTHTKDQVGLGNVDNTADSDKSVKSAASAKKLETARTINGTAFDGTKNINTQYSYNFNGYSTAVAFIPFANIPNSGSQLNRNCSLLISGGTPFSTGVWPLFFVTFRWYNDFYIDVVAIKDTGDNVDIGYYTKSGRIYIALHAKQGYANYTMTVLGSATAGDLNLGFGTALTTQPSGWTVATKRVLQDAGQVAAATVDKARNVTGTVAIANGGTGATTAQNARSNLGALGDVLVGSYHGMTTASGSDSLYIRTTSKGILPYENNSTDGASQIGTSSWPFQAVYAKTFHGSATDQTARNAANAAMPKSGGTFTGNVAAYGTNRADACLRNIYVQKDVTWEQVSTNSILMVRK